MGKHLVLSLLSEQEHVTIATRGITKDDFGNQVQRIYVDRASEDSIKSQLAGRSFDVIFDNLVYCSNDVKILLDHVSCKRYIFISSASIYNKHMNTTEYEFNPYSGPIVWCGRGDFPYAERKRQAERAAMQGYKNIDCTAVRFPFVIGKDDYTNRFRYYVDHIKGGIPMKIDNFEEQMAFVRSDEAGKFLAMLTKKEFSGCVNGASVGTISIKDVADYIKQKTGKSIIMSEEAEPAPYNGENAYSINIDRAQEIGFVFSRLHDWVFDLLDYYIGLEKTPETT